jgi:hypothetical protein
VRRTLLFGGLGVLGVVLLVLALLVGILVGRNLTGGSGAGGSDSALEQRDAVEERAPSPYDQPPEPIDFSGTGSQDTKPFKLSAGLARVEMAHQGESNFIVTLLDDKGDSVGPSLVNVIGPFYGSQEVQIREDGTYRLEVFAEPRGTWTIRVHKPSAMQDA